MIRPQGIRRERGVGRQLVVAMLLPLVLLGCASSPPSIFYTLTAIPSASADAARVTQAGKGSSLSIGLGPVSFPSFLDRPQVVQREGGNRLALDEFHRWGGSLDDDFLRVLSENLGLLLRTSRILVFPTELRMPLDFRVTVEVIAFEAGPADNAVLKVRWVVMRPETGQVLSMRDGTYRQRLPAGASVAQQVAGLSAALADFSQEVAEVLIRLPRPKVRRADSLTQEVRATDASQPPAAAKAAQPASPVVPAS